MRPHDAPPTAGDAPLSESTLVDYAKSLDCIHCGLCLQTCPTYRLTGVETSSPRGRIHLMRAVGEARVTPDGAYAEELDFCLLCRHCESVCPAGVRFGEMMEVARARREGAVPRGPIARLLRHVSFRVLLPSRRLLRLTGTLLRLAQTLGLDRLVAKLGGARGRGLADLPRVPPARERRLLARETPGVGSGNERAQVLEGCVQPELFPHVNRATVDALTRLGVTADVPHVTCCGSLQAHNGDLDAARALALRLLDAFAGSQPIVVNSAGCGAHMRELQNLFAPEDPLHARARAFAERVVDFAEFVEPRLGERRLPVAPERSPLTWDDPCHLCHGQGVRAEPRAVLARLDGVETVALRDSESCCGSAGIYSLLRPADSQAVFAPKLEAFRATGARTLVTENPGCQLQWESGLRRAGEPARVVHLAELVAEGLGSEPAPPASTKAGP